MPIATPAYVLADNNVHDPDAYQEYIEKIAPTVATYGGKYLARGGEVVAISGNRRWQRVVLIQFPNKALAQAWIDAPELAPIHEMRKQHATTEMIILTGIPD
ncbi:MAG: DUF1330 domain-containing protein [Gammaproteobacteria bacterium]|nr:DUF1330 domain-containing protein [Gammaproteobacteria bacterium]